MGKNNPSPNKDAGYLYLAKVPGKTIAFLFFLTTRMSLLWAIYTFPILRQLIWLQSQTAVCEAQFFSFLNLNWTYDVDLTSPSSDRMIQPGITDKWCTVPSNKYRLSNYLGHLTINYPTTLQILNEYLCLSPCQSTLSSARIFFFFPNMVKIQFLLCLKALSGFPPCTGRRQVLSQEPSDCPCSS